MPSFSFLRDYMSAKGITVEKTEAGYRLGNPLVGNWQSFASLAELHRHISTFY